MIVAEQKPLDEIKGLIASATKVLVVGCGTCDGLFCRRG